jgi:hypothetical protein
VAVVASGGGGGVGPLNPPHVGDFNPWLGQRWLVMVLLRVLGKGAAWAARRGGRDTEGERCCYFYGPAEGVIP